MKRGGGLKNQWDDGKDQIILVRWSMASDAVAKYDDDGL